jgi:hypothetical protein
MTEVTGADIMEGVEGYPDIQLHIDEVSENDGFASEKIRAFVSCTDTEGKQVRMTVWANSVPDAYPFEEDRWYRLSGVRTDTYKGTPTVAPNDYTDIETIADPTADEEPAPPDSEPAETTVPTAEPEPEPEQVRVALDIETITTVPESEFDLQPARSDVLLREGSSPEAELDLVTDLVRWLNRQGGDVLLTYNGEWDIGHLKARAERAASAAGIADGRPELIAQVLDEQAHTDLSAGTLRALGGGSLEKTMAHVGCDVRPTRWDVYAHDLDPREWRGAQRAARENPPSDDLDDVRVFNSDVPHFGAAYLEGLEEAPDSARTAALEELLVRYTLADIDPLFEIAEHEDYVGLPHL